MTNDELETVLTRIRAGETLYLRPGGNAGVRMVTPRALYKFEKAGRTLLRVVDGALHVRNGKHWENHRYSSAIWGGK